MANAKPSGPGRRAKVATGPGAKATPVGVKKVRRGGEVFQVTELSNGDTLETRVDSLSDFKDGVKHEDAEIEE